MAKALTAAALEKLKPGAVRKEIPDGLLAGLYFVIQPSGHRSWAIRYRVAGRPRKMVLGPYPRLLLAAARDEARTHLRRVQEGRDPGAEKVAGRKNATGGASVDRIARSFLARHAKPSNRSWIETARLLGLKPKDKGELDPEKFEVIKGGIVARWGRRDLSTITRGEIIALLDEIVDRGAPTLANRTLSALRKLCNWAFARDLLQLNPCAGVKPPSPEVARDRVLSDAELRAFWKACDEIGQPFGQLFKILALTLQRREEVAGMRDTEIEGDTWIIPRERAKNNKAHSVPLSAAASKVLKEITRVCSERGLLFTTTGATPVSGISRAKVRLDAAMVRILKAEAIERGADPTRVSLAPWRLHDLRRTGASGMARLGIALPVIERVLNHVSGTFGGIVGVYQRHEFGDEKRAALDLWAKHVLGLAVTKRQRGRKGHSS